jgi:hypothetical protein
MIYGTITKKVDNIITVDFNKKKEIFKPVLKTIKSVWKENTDYEVHIDEDQHISNNKKLEIIFGVFSYLYNRIELYKDAKNEIYNDVYMDNYEVNESRFLDYIDFKINTETYNKPDVNDAYYKDHPYSTKVEYIIKSLNSPNLLKATRLYRENHKKRTEFMNIIEYNKDFYKKCIFPTYIKMLEREIEQKEERKELFNMFNKNKL